jgi:hypothetical protein
MIDRFILGGDQIGFVPCGVGTRRRCKRKHDSANSIERPPQIDGGRPRRIERGVCPAQRIVARVMLEREREAVGADRTHIVRIAIAAASALAIFTAITAWGRAR